MPKHLLIVRHAKSDWGDINLPDSQRPLNSRGIRNVPEMAKRLVAKNLVPKQLVSSTAVRAITTAELFADVVGMESSGIIQREEIYEASVSTLLEVINSFDNHSDFTALFGHNPGVTVLVGYLTGQNLSNIPTCGMALITFPFDDWEMVSSGTGHLEMYDFPKNG